ncbi:glutathione S-transferase N-terminal domain-containing protein [uncultured Reyranella sp.]|uniref:glutathione S-transferase N-terminal domain-containing protein n=1 Tax=uncultured Reyranella sp. TaxID=735512 RepID=UPI0025EAF5FE|nr:glutathione S-transferase N-terminal domain-containing protein [uncultured Reyranella sp.]
MLAYTTPAEIVAHDGLRIVLVRGAPSPWSQAAKTILEIKGLDYAAAPLDVGGANEEIVAWSGQNSAPVVAWRDGPPLNRWLDILLLAERLAPAPALLPADPLQRALAIGLGHEILGERGIAWNRRLQMFSMAVQAGMGTRMAPLIDKYGFDADDAAAAGTRIATTLHGLATQLRAQQARGVSYFVGEALSCVDIYWTSVMSMLLPLPAAQCPIRESSRPAFTATDPQIVSALDPILVEHRDRIFKAHFRDPMEF